jgi:poly(3-hydroxybutyrate) depolymerase
VGNYRRFLICSLLSTLSFAATSGANSAHCTAGGSPFDQKYLYYSPDAAAHLPVVMLLHGAGDQPANMMDAWKLFAGKQGIVLLAPELPRELSYEAKAPAIFRCVVEDAEHFVQIDPQRVYVFGNSMGGYLAYDAAMFESQFFAAIAVHGMRLDPDYAGIVKKATRKTPVAIYIGDHDQFSSIDSVRKTRDLLRREGFPVHYVELENHDHNYYAVSGHVNADAWKFMKDIRLPDAPR